MLRIGLTITALATLSLGALGACSLATAVTGERTARCDLRPKTPQCTDWTGIKAPTTAAYNTLCTSLTAAKGGGSFGDDQTCEKNADLLGGCQGTMGDGSKQTNWYYKGEKYADVAAAKSECAGGQDFVNP